MDNQERIDARATEIMRNEPSVVYEEAVRRATKEIEPPAERLPGFVPVYHMPGYQPPEPPLTFKGKLIDPSHPEYERVKAAGHEQMTTPPAEPGED